MKLLIAFMSNVKNFAIACVDFLFLRNGLAKVLFAYLLSVVVVDTCD